MLESLFNKVAGCHASNIANISERLLPKSNCSEATVHRNSGHGNMIWLYIIIIFPCSGEQLFEEFQKIFYKSTITESFLVKKKNNEEVYNGCFLENYEICSTTYIFPKRILTFIFLYYILLILKKSCIKFVICFRVIFFRASFLWIEVICLIWIASEHRTCTEHA